MQVAHPLPDGNYEVPLQGKVTSSWDDIPTPGSSETVFSIFHTSRSQTLQNFFFSSSSFSFTVPIPLLILEEGHFLTSCYLARSYPGKPVSWTPLLWVRSIFLPTEGLSDHLPCNFSTQPGCIIPLLISTVKMEAACPTAMLIPFYKNKRCHNP